jgi:hypothetical protein
MAPRSFFDDENDLTPIQLASPQHACTTSSTTSTTYPSLDSVAGAAPVISPTQSPSRRTVTFSCTRMEQIHDVLHYRDFTMDEKSDCWYNGWEVKYFKQESKYMANMFSAGAITEDTDDFCRRGLEARNRAGKQERRRIKNDCLFTVLREQALMLEDEGCIDSESLRDVYHSFTFQSRMEAFARATSDAYEAQRV